MNLPLTEEIPHVYRLALRLCRDQHLAEDLTQETMLKAVRNFESLKSHERLRVWLLRILANCWKDHVRRSIVRPADCELFDVPDSRVASHVDVISQQEEAQQAIRTLDSLPERQRAVLYLFAVEQLSLAEVGEVLGIQASTAKVNLFHARQSMKKMVSTRTGIGEAIAPEREADS